MLGNIYCTIHRNKIKEINVIVGEMTEEQQKKMERKVSRAMGEGLQVEWPDGSRQWIDIHPFYSFDADESAASGYIWNTSGDRIKCEYILKTLASDKTISRKVIKTRFVNFDKVFA